MYVRLLTFVSAITMMNLPASSMREGDFSEDDHPFKRVRATSPSQEVVLLPLIDKISEAEILRIQGCRAALKEEDKTLFPAEIKDDLREKIIKVALTLTAEEIKLRAEAIRAIDKNLLKRVEEFLKTKFCDLSCAIIIKNALKIYAKELEPRATAIYEQREALLPKGLYKVSAARIIGKALNLSEKEIHRRSHALNEVKDIFLSDETEEDIQELIIWKALELSSTEIKARAAAIEEHLEYFLVKETETFEGTSLNDLEGVIVKALEFSPKQIQKRLGAIYKYKNILLPEGLNGDERAELICKAIMLPVDQLNFFVDAFRLHKEDFFPGGMEAFDRAKIMESSLSLPFSELTARIQIIAKEKKKFFAERGDTSSYASLLSNLLRLTGPILKMVAAHTEALFTNLDNFQRANLMWLNNEQILSCIPAITAHQEFFLPKGILNKVAIVKRLLEMSAEEIKNRKAAIQRNKEKLFPPSMDEKMHSIIILNALQVRNITVIDNNPESLRIEPPSFSLLDIILSIFPKDRLEA